MSPQFHILLYWCYRYMGSCPMSMSMSHDSIYYLIDANVMGSIPMSMSMSHDSIYYLINASVMGPCPMSMSHNSIYYLTDPSAMGSCPCLCLCPTIPYTTSPLTCLTSGFPLRSINVRVVLCGRILSRCNRPPFSSSCFLTPSLPLPFSSHPPPPLYMHDLNSLKPSP